MSENMESQLDILKTAKNNKKQKGLTWEKNLAKISKPTFFKIYKNKNFSKYHKFSLLGSALINVLFWSPLNFKSCSYYYSQYDQ